MRLNDLKNRLLQVFTRGEGDASRRPDGGTSCYRPIRRKSQAEILEQEESPLTYIHTGFTGMNPPAGAYDTGFGTDPYSQQNAYNHFAPMLGKRLPHKAHIPRTLGHRTPTPRTAVPGTPDGTGQRDPLQLRRDRSAAGSRPGKKPYPAAIFPICRDTHRTPGLRRSAMWSIS